MARVKHHFLVFQSCFGGCAVGKSQCEIPHVEPEEKDVLFCVQYGKKSRFSVEITDWHPSTNDLLTHTPKRHFRLLVGCFFVDSGGKAFRVYNIAFQEEVTLSALLCLSVATNHCLFPHYLSLFPTRASFVLHLFLFCFVHCCGSSTLFGWSTGRNKQEKARENKQTTETTALELLRIVLFQNKKSTA